MPCRCRLQILSNPDNQFSTHHHERIATSRPITADIVERTGIDKVMIARLVHVFTPRYETMDCSGRSSIAASAVGTIIWSVCVHSGRCPRERSQMTSRCKSTYRFRGKSGAWRGRKERRLAHERVLSVMPLQKPR